MRKAYLFRSVGATVVAISLLVFAASCHKNKIEDTGYANDNATAEQTFSDVQIISDQAAMSSGATLGYRTTATTIGGCATITRSPGQIVIDFGTTNCTCHDGRKRRGQMIITYTGGGYFDSGSTHTITFNNFYENDNKVTGTKTVTNMGTNSLGQPYFHVTESGSVTHSSGGTVSIEWNRMRTMVAGYSTPNDITDDVYETTGSGTLTRANGKSISAVITAPLVVAYGCYWVEAGAVTFSVATGETRVLNYGDTPNCDNVATITLGNGTVRNITLP